MDNKKLIEEWVSKNGVTKCPPKRARGAYLPGLSCGSSLSNSTSVSASMEYLRVRSLERKDKIRKYYKEQKKLAKMSFFQRLVYKVKKWWK